MSEPDGLLARFAPEPRLLLGIFSSTVIAYLPLFVMPWVLGSIMTDLKLTAVQAGAIGTATSLSLAASFIIVGAIVPKLHPRKTVLAGIVLVLASQAILTQFDSTRVIIAGLVIFAVGSGLCGAIGTSLISKAKNPTKIAGGLWALLAIAQGIIWMIVPRMADANGVSGLFNASLAISLLIAPLVLLVPARKEVLPDADPQVAVTATSVAPRPAVIVLMLTLVGAFWLRDGIIWSLADQRAAAIGIGAGALANTLLGTSLVGFIGAIAATQFESRFSLRRNIIGGLLLVGAVMLSIATAGTTAVYLGSFLFWAGTSIFAWTFILGIAAEFDSAGRIVAIAGGLSFAAGALGPLSGGILLEYYSGALLVPSIITLTIFTIFAALFVVQNLPQRSLP